jgi:hypothetical protein
VAGVFDPYSHFTGPQALAVSKFLGAWKANPIVKAIDPWHRPGELTHVVPGAPLKSYVDIPLHTPGLQRFSGRFTFDQNSGRIATVERGAWQKGSKCNEFQGAEYDIGRWSKAPGTVAIEIGNNAPLSLVYILNGCYAGTPKNAAGTAIYLPGTTTVDPALTAYEQVYFDFSQQKPLVVLDSDSANHRPVNPFDLNFMSGSKWYNAKENTLLTAPNITAAIKNLQQRRAMNGIELNLDEGLEIWVPYSLKEDARLLMEVFRQLPGTGTASPANATQVAVDGGGGISQVIYSVQDSPVFGRAKVRAISGMRSDLWCIVAPNVLREPSMSLFMHVHGGNVGEYAINEEPAKPDNNTVPHIWVYPWAKGSPLWAGTMEGSKAGDIGITMMVNEGFAAMTGLLLEARFTGAAS